jgi:thiamine-phosphate pyrophosphorylase
MNSYRIIDANVNRACEGLRVLEDIYRFIFNDETRSKSLRDVKHTLRKLNIVNINFRDAYNDVGKKVSMGNTNDKKTSLNSVIDANYARVQEALRSIEENLKLVDKYSDAKRVESIRFTVYELQRKSINKKYESPDIYGITCEEISNGISNIEMTKKMLEAGIKVIQYRDKVKSKNEKVVDCKEIKKLCKEKGATFIINDDIDIALLVDPDGIHLGQDDISITYARQLLPSKIIGVSTHNKDQAIKAEKEGADYIGVGPIFKTTTKKNPEDCNGLDFLKWVSENINIPYVAIGGIDRDNLISCIENGGRTFAIIGDIVASDDIEKSVNIIKNIIKENI